VFLFTVVTVCRLRPGITQRPCQPQTLNKKPGFPGLSGFHAVVALNRYVAKSNVILVFDKLIF
jgi:hypothetical protein